MGVDVRRIGWVVSGARPEALASYRYTALIPAAELGSLTLKCEPSDDVDALLDDHNPSAIVLGKAFHQGFVQLASAARARGIPVLAAMCDWHFENPINQALANVAHRVVVQTKSMAEEVRRHFAVQPAIIEEPYEGPRGQARIGLSSPIRMVWFGQAANLDTLADGVTQVGALAQALHLTVVTNDLQAAQRAMSRIKPLRARVSVELTPWSLAAQYAKIAECDVVLLPSNPGRDKQVKGHNRLVQAIHAGRLALAYPLPQYRELEDFCWCGPDLGEGLQWALNNREAVLNRILAGQLAIDARFAPARIAARWCEEINAVEAEIKRGETSG